MLKIVLLLLLLLLLIYICPLGAQTIYIVDTLNQPIPYAKIFVKDSGFYSDSYGTFNLDKLVNEKLLISHLGFKDYEFNASTSDTIQLTREEISLETIFLSSKKAKDGFKKLKFPKRPKSLSFLPLSLNNEAIVNIRPQTTDSLRRFENIYFKLAQLKENKSPKGVFRLNTYDSLSNIVTSKLVEIENLKDNILTFTIPAEFNSMKGFSLGIEVIALENHSEKTTSFIGIALTSKKYKDLSVVTYLAYPLSKSKGKIAINEHFSNLISDKDFKRNLSFSIEYSN